MAHLEIFETEGSRQLLRPAALMEGKGRAAVTSWARALGEADDEPFEVTFKSKTHGHELFEVRVGDRVFSVIAH